MPSEYSTLIPSGLATLVLAVGMFLSVRVARRFGRPAAWLCGAGCLVLFAVHLMRFLWAAGAIRPTQGRVLGKMFEFGMQISPLVEAAGLVLLITAALRGKQMMRDSLAPVEHHPLRQRRLPFLQRTVAFPAWAAGTTVVLVVGVLIVIAAAIPTDDAVPRLVEGTVTEHADDSLGFRFVADEAPGDPELYWPNSRFWVDSGGAQRNDGRPSCLRPDAPLPQRVVLAFLDVKGGREHVFGDIPYLLSIRCLG